jgi:hypothetical protein
MTLPTVILIRLHIWDRDARAVEFIMSPVVTGLRSLGTIGVAAGFNHGAWNGMDRSSPA